MCVCDLLDAKYKLIFAFTKFNTLCYQYKLKINIKITS